MRQFCALAPIILCLTGTAVVAQEISPAVARYEAGVICPATGNEVPSLPFVARTLVVPAVQGMGFGVRALTTEVVGPVQARIVLSHPPMGPSGAIRQEFSLTLSPTHLAGFHYRFDGPEELLPGTWRVQAQSGGTVLFAVDFNVVAPGPNDGLVRACGL